MVSWSELPLHGGKVPPHLLVRMKGLAKAIVEVMVEEWGPDELVYRLSDPFWFQAFNNVIGMDWDSSGSTTVVLGVLKEISWKEDLGFLVLGGKGKKMLKVKEEAEVAAKRLNVDPEELRRVSKASARLDSALLQDGYEVYIHSLIVSERAWTVVQQGMNEELALARRYQLNHLNAPWEVPHSAVAGRRGEALDLTSKASIKTIDISLDIIDEGPKRVLSLLKSATAALKGQRNLRGEVLRGPQLKFYYPVRPSPQLERALADLYEFRPKRREELLVAPGAGPKVMRALALISHLIYGAAPSFEDPVTVPLDPFLYSYAVGGKDGVPYPYDVKTADEVIKILEEVVARAKVGEKERLRALRRLSEMVENLHARGA
ncbi:DUF763 domain-containing protein [Ignicoccus hospitalis]|uniref:DUF763 domain-containing protein n=1 Tax=Ignicoccus hospitalis (strain KIN4/I / DSM 18386 / JCM 14125) TaxID=453591 RepID=A8A8N7_IGNH4|nr:DUF763 domain-containing protein [Ignicoccus hospitalis]ABU81289.1 protein of unknown function DUF763 [Ignicoccus hospitalis KIN4/I]HIH90407.1 DUF763 domain-containing protein [Desulfurococcaceae archaeon]